MLEAVCRNAEHVIIIVGSANKYNVRNPFTVDESAEMIEAFLSPRFSHYEIWKLDDFGHIPEYADGTKWKEEVIALCGERECFVSANPYVQQLLREHYTIVEPHTLMDPREYVKLRATEVRMEMARGEKWRSLVPPDVECYLDRNGLVDRFRKEFGLAALALLAYGSDGNERETYDEELLHARSV